MLQFTLIPISVITENPRQRETPIPYGRQAQFNCSVLEGYSIEWEVTLPSQNPIYTSSIAAINSLSSRGIHVRTISERNSQLVVNALAKNNATQVMCISTRIASPNSNFFSDEVEIVVSECNLIIRAKIMACS